MTRVRTISPQDAEGDVLAAYQRMTGQEQPKMVGNIFEAISIRPRQMESLMDLTMAVNRANDDSGLSALQRWMIGTVASVANRCRYWTTANAEASLGAGGTVDLARQIKANYREADITPAELAMLEFTELLTVAPANVVEEDIQALRDAGWSDEDIIDIVHMTALINYFNRIGDALGVDLDDMLQVAEDRDRDFVDPAAWAAERAAAASSTAAGAAGGN